MYTQFKSQIVAQTFFELSKIKNLTIVTIDSIKEVRLGKTNERLRRHAQQFENESLFSIIYTDGNSDCVSLDLVTNSADEANIWVTGLSCLIAGHGSPATSAGRKIYLNDIAQTQVIPESLFVGFFFL